MNYDRAPSVSSIGDGGSSAFFPYYGTSAKIAGYGFLASVLSMVATSSLSSAERCFTTDQAGEGCSEVAREALGMGGKSGRSERCAKHSFEVSRFGFQHGTTA